MPGLLIFSWGCKTKTYIYIYIYIEEHSNNLMIVMGSKAWAAANPHHFVILNQMLLAQHCWAKRRIANLLTEKTSALSLLSLTIDDCELSEKTDKYTGIP